ncbi:MAG: TIM barrel protein [bacterium]
MIDEIIGLGINYVELSYDLSYPLLEGVRKMAGSGAIVVTSVHAFCPVPARMPHASPELFTLADPDKQIRALAISHLSDTILLASELGAPTVVVHAGNVNMRNLTHQLIDLCHNGQQFSDKYDRIKDKLLLERHNKAPSQIQFLYESLDNLLPILQKTNVSVALENLPSWESIPSETEMEKLLNHYQSPHIRYWHDIGHGQIRQNLGFIAHIIWLEKLQPYLAGMHVHDVIKPVRDHLMPPAGNIDFKAFMPFVGAAIPGVLEAYPDVAPDDIREAIKLLSALWQIKSKT